MRSTLAVFVAGAGLFVAAASSPLLAHHSFAAEFDSTKAITLQGTVTKIGLDESAHLDLSGHQGR